jgi:hypothetical protein
MKAVEIIPVGNGKFGVRVYAIIVFTGTYQECVVRAEQE